MAQKDADGKDTCEGGKCRDDRRYRDTQQEAKDVMQESSTLLKSVAQRLDAAAAKLAKYGDAPFGDLER